LKKRTAGTRAQAAGEGAGPKISPKKRAKGAPITLGVTREKTLFLRRGLLEKEIEKRGLGGAPMANILKKGGQGDLAELNKLLRGGMLRAARKA